MENKTVATKEQNLGLNPVSQVIAAPTTALTPMLQQFWDIKNQHQDKILLYRMGDFYEMFFDDAVKSAPLLNIALTSRSKSQGADIPMCGVPHHSIGPQINKLLAAGLKVAICDQMEAPQAGAAGTAAHPKGKGIVKRAVTRVVTPGMVYDAETLDSSQQLYVAAIIKNGESCFAVAVIDASTGEFMNAENLSRGELSEFLEKFNVREIVVEDEKVIPFEVLTVQTLKKRNSSESASAYLLNYVQDTQGADILQIVGAPQSLLKNPLKISPTTLRHLEIFKRADGEETPTLFSTVNLNRSPMGARLLRRRLALPFGNKKDVEESLTMTQFFFENEELRRELRTQISQIGDLERKVARLSNPLCNGRDLQSLGKSLKVATVIFENAAIQSLFSIKTQEIRGLADKILCTLQDELPHSTKEGSLIRVGVSANLDEYVDLATHAQTKLSELEERERKKSGIQSLKIKYNSTFGYSFEVTKANLEKVPSHFVRRQTLTQGERYITQELSDLESKILSSRQKRCDLEHQMYLEIKSLALKQARPSLALCSSLGTLDLALSWAQLASERNYCRPEFHEKGIELRDSRHPVLENPQTHQVETFIPNDIILDHGHCVLLTGPNMAGKSTLMRQVALTAILAHCGSFVPASDAKLPLFDQIFTRIGASDNLSAGLSTFMVEMTETASIVASATEKSLVILDEIGRGTSTYDGMSLAQATLEYFLKNIRSFTFFATHYHELTDLSQVWSDIVSAHMSIKEHRGELVFLRKLKMGPANRSYGIEVARKAGLPKELTQRAREILDGLDAKGKELGRRQLSLLEHKLEPLNIDEPAPDPKREMWDELSQKFESLEINSLTPLEALNRLSQIKKSFQDLQS